MAASPSLVPTVSVPTVSVPTVSVPTVTVPTTTVPSITAGPITTPQITTPQITTPQVTTPPVTTPSTPPLPTPAVQVPSTGTPLSGSRSPSPSSGTAAEPSTGSGTGASQSTASGTPSRSTSRGPSASGASPSAGGSRGRTGQAGGRQAAAAARRARSGQPTASRDRAAAASNNGRATSRAGQGAKQTTSTPKPKTSSGPFVRLVKVLPTAVLFALLAFAVIAAAMALNAYIQRRRAKSLAGQKAALLDDVGVLQAALLPAVPESVGDLAVSVAYRPAQGLAAGGDFFDVFALSSETTDIIIGDVSGHGRESLIHAALVRYTLRTLMGEGHPLPEVLARADRYLTGELGDGYATVVICRYEHATGELVWAKAGHEPPIVAGQPDREEQAATPLGFGFGGAWPQFSRVLEPSERICLFTDGLTEARRGDEYLGRDHLRSLVEQGLSAQALLERIQADADDCPDDLAAVIISRAPVADAVHAPEAPDALQPATV